MGLGKWQYGNVIAQEPGRERPFDRDMPRRNPIAGGANRQAIEPIKPGGPALERLVNFIDCATCADPSKCALPKSVSAEKDSARLSSRAEPDRCQPQPFFVVLSPSIPHSKTLPDRYCPLFPRDAAQCSQEPYRSHSVYCRYNPAFDLDGNGTLEGNEFPSCSNLTRWFGQISVNLETDGRPREAGILRHNSEYYRWVNVLDRAVDEMRVQLEVRGLADRTVLFTETDNGFAVAENAKGHFTENGYRSPIIYYNPVEEPLPSDCLPGLPGCRSEFANALDILATMRELTGMDQVDCPPPGVECDDCCPLPRPDGKSRYSEGRSLRSGTPRSCDFPSSFDEARRARYHQCLIGRRQGGSQSTVEGDSWYVLAEVADPENPSKTELCKLYARKCSTRVLNNLRYDPNENIDLNHENIPSDVCEQEQSYLESLLTYSVIQKGWLASCSGPGSP